jgi:hypothetical protein
MLHYAALVTCIKGSTMNTFQIPRIIANDIKETWKLKLSQPGYERRARLGRWFFAELLTKK